MSVMDVLVGLAWKTFPFCLGVLLLLHLVRRQPPAQRSRLAFLGIVLVPTLPLLSAVLPAIAVHADYLGKASLPWFSPAGTNALADPPNLSGEEAFRHFPVRTLLLLLWATGASALLIRLLCGLSTLARWTREGLEVEQHDWRAELGRRDGRQVWLLLHPEVESPLSWGWRNPVILIGTNQLKEPVSAKAILAHELAHVRRGDWQVLLLARLISALFWFNPFVLLLEKACLRNMEEAADAEAIRTVQPHDYAYTLLRIASTRRFLPANGICSNILSRRILRVLDCPDQQPAECAKVVAILPLLALAAPLAALRVMPQEVAHSPVAAAARTATWHGSTAAAENLAEPEPAAPQRMEDRLRGRSLRRALHSAPKAEHSLPQPVVEPRQESLAPLSSREADLRRREAAMLLDQTRFDAEVVLRDQAMRREQARSDAEVVRRDQMMRREQARKDAAQAERDRAIAAAAHSDASSRST